MHPVEFELVRKNLKEGVGPAWRFPFGIIRCIKRLGKTKRRAKGQTHGKQDSAPERVVAHGLPPDVWNGVVNQPGFQTTAIAVPQAGRWRHLRAWMHFFPSEYLSPTFEASRIAAIIGPGWPLAKGIREMKTFKFDIVLKNVAEITDEQANAIFAAGCDDGTPACCNGISWIHFDRKASSLEEAIRRAAEQIQAAGFGVGKVELDGEWQFSRD
jgi:hypothetical protein